MDDQEFDGPEVARPFTGEQILMETLQARTRISAEIQVELSRKSVMGDLLQFKRESALAALAKLIDVHPQQTHEIIGLQEQVKSFLADCEWIHARLELGREADSQIREIWGADHDDRDGDEPD